MSLEPELPFEFVVRGITVSLQASSGSREAWKSTVRAAAQASLPEGSWLLDGRIAVTIYIFPGAQMRGDIDNRVKPILDALSRAIYRDDELIERLVVQKFEPQRVFTVVNPSAVLASALAMDGPAVYIRISDDFSEEIG